MSLKKVTLKNFRTCHDVELNDLEHLTVLMGRNGVGKTNILQGIEWLARTASSSKPADIDFLDNESIMGGVSLFGEIELLVDNINYRYRLEFNCKTIDLKERLYRSDSSNQWQVLLERDGDTVIDETGKQLAKIHQTLPMLHTIVRLKPWDKIREVILPALTYLHGFKYYPLDEAATPSTKKRTEFIYGPDYLIWSNQFKSLDEPNDPDYDVVMRLLDMFLQRKEEFNELNNLLASNGLGLLYSIDIGELKQSRPSHTPSLYFVDFIPGKGWEGAEVLPRLPYKKLSSGTQRIIRILVSFFYDRNSLYLFEQPEDAIHPGLLRKLIGLLRSYDDRGQLIMASHSSDLFDVLKPEEVRLVTMQGGETKVRGLTESELASAKRFINEEGSLSDYLDLLETD